MKKRENIFIRFDNFILKLVNKNMNNRFFDQFFTRFTNLAGGLSITVFIFACYFFSTSEFSKTFAIQMLAGQILTQAVAHTIKFLAKRLRPYEVLEWLNTFDIIMRDYSFPSGHTASAFSIALVGARFFPAFAIGFYIYAVLIGISRLYLAVHFPTDVFVGALVGSLMTFISLSSFGPWLVNLILV